ncbi:MAG TPA: hypothetical protein VFO83_12255, partial [Aggregicoccus sp.]|nr:hypothetical protein [Aggregicoccus sp.]
MSHRLALLLLLLLGSPVLAAEVTGSLRAGLGVGVASGFNEPSLLSAGVRGQLGALLSGEHAVFGVARLQPLSDLRLRDQALSFSLGVGYERRFALYQGWRPTLGVTVGVGAAELCAQDVCNMRGPAAGLDLGLHRLLGERAHLVLSAELLTVVGAGVVEGTLLLPTAWA